MSEHPLQLDKQDHVAIVPLDRPEKLNALSSALQSALHEAVPKFVTTTRFESLLLPAPDEASALERI